MITVCALRFLYYIILLMRRFFSLFVFVLFYIFNALAVNAFSDLWCITFDVAIVVDILETKTIKESKRRLILKISFFFSLKNFVFIFECCRKWHIYWVHHPIWKVNFFFLADIMYFVIVYLNADDYRKSACVSLKPMRFLSSLSMINS